MSIFKVHKKQGFTTVCNELARSDRLSARAKGIMLYFLSHVEAWDVSEADICRHMADGVKSIRAGLKELMLIGHVVRSARQRDEHGHLRGYLYDVYEEPPKRTQCRKPKSRPMCVGSHGYTGRQVEAAHSLAAEFNRRRKGVAQGGAQVDQ